MEHPGDLMLGSYMPTSRGVAANNTTMRECMQPPKRFVPGLLYDRSRLFDRLAVQIAGANLHKAVCM